MTLNLSDSEARSVAQGERVLWRVIPSEDAKCLTP